MTRRPDEASRRRLVLTTIWHWDLWLAVVGLAVFLLAALASGDFRGSQPILVAGVPTGVAIAAAAWLGGRWVADRLRTEAYGELVRLVDPREEAAALPYQVVSIVAMLATIACGVAAGVVNGVGRGASIVLHGVALLLSLWAVAGLASLIGLTFRHQHRIAEIQSLKEEVEHLQREHGRDEGS